MSVLFWLMVVLTLEVLGLRLLFRPHLRPIGCFIVPPRNRGTTPAEPHPRWVDQHDYG
jgi:hypothetical protein